MAITSNDTLKAAIAAGRTVQFFKVSITSVAGFYYTTWRTQGMPTGNTSLPTTTGAALSRSSTGALPIPAPSGTSYCSSYEALGTIAGSWLVCDRLVEFGGLSGTSTTGQNVSALALPSRATGATDVELWIDIMAVAGNTASATVTASYTNQSGTSGRTATLIGGIPATGTPVNRQYQMSLQAGDTGVQSVQSFTSGTSTGSAGNIGLVLRRTLLTGAVPLANLGFVQSWAETDLQIIPDDAALELLVLATTTTTGGMQGALGISQG